MFLIFYLHTFVIHFLFTFLTWCCWLDDRKVIWPVRICSAYYGSSQAVVRVISSVCNFVSVCPWCKRKTAWAINTKLGRHTVHSSRSACIDAEVKGQGHMHCQHGSACW